jgi:hypothetical protein
MQKIAIVSMPRTASKVVMKNFSLYTIAKYGDISKLFLDNNHVRPCTDEFLNPGFQELFVGRAKLLNTGDICITKIPFDNLSQELADRVQIVNQISKPVVLKYFPFRKYLDITNPVLEFIDKTYYLGRKDLFSHVLSSCISYQTNAWVPDEVQKNIIKDTIRNKISISEKLFRNILNEFRYYNASCYGKLVFEFDDIIKLRDSRDFCDMFRLEFTEFKFTNSESEFVNNKELMINNIDDLRKIMGDDAERPLPLS